MKIPHRTPLLFLLLQLQASMFFNSLSIASSLNHSSSNDDDNAHLLQVFFPKISNSSYEHEPRHGVYYDFTNFDVFFLFFIFFIRMF